jgi:hypothetical protein
MTPNFEKLLRETLTTYDVSEGNGVQPVNIADGLMAIAEAIHHLANAYEAKPPMIVAVHPDHIEMEERPGHA